MNHSAIYRFAQGVIDEHGSHAADHADAMLSRFLKDDDLKSAGTWLMIGEAVDALLARRPQKTIAS